MTPGTSCGGGEVARGQPQVFVLQELCSDKASHLPGAHQAGLAHWAPSSRDLPTHCLPGTGNTILPPCPVFFTQVLEIKLRSSHHVTSTLLGHLSIHTLRPSACPLISFALALGDRRTFHLICSPHSFRFSRGSGLWEIKKSGPLLNNCTMSLLGSPSSPGAAPSQPKLADLVAPIRGSDGP